jgi:hypothetical protein
MLFSKCLRRLLNDNFIGIDAVEAKDAVGFGQVAVGVEIIKAAALFQRRGWRRRGEGLVTAFDEGCLSTNELQVYSNGQRPCLSCLLNSSSMPLALA